MAGKRGGDSMEGWTHARTRADDCVLLVSWGQPDFRDGMVPVALRAGCAMGMGLSFSFLASACLPACLVCTVPDFASTCASREKESALLCFALPDTTPTCTSRTYFAVS